MEKKSLISNAAFDEAGWYRIIFLFFCKFQWWKNQYWTKKKQNCGGAARAKLKHQNKVLMRVLSGQDKHCLTLYHYNAEICENKPWRPKVFFQWDHHKCLSYSSFHFISILMLCVYCGHYKFRLSCLKSIPALKGLNLLKWSIAIIFFFNSFSAGTDFTRQNLASIDVRLWRVKTPSPMKRLKRYINPLTAGAAYIRVFIFF